jgi:HAE1 family hydrophobic/amphiphilic exporter-1
MDQNEALIGQEATPEIQWKVDRRKASLFGVSFQDVASTINTATNGSIAGYFQEKGFQYPIVVQMPESTRKTVSAMQDLTISPSYSGKPSSILLSQVASPQYGTGPSEITRLNRQRYIAVSGAPQGRSSGEIQADVQKALTGLEMPQGYRWDWGSNQKRRSEEFGGMWLAVLLAIGLIYMLLASQFESLIHPLTILLSVPLAASGVLLALIHSMNALYGTDPDSAIKLAEGYSEGVRIDLDEINAFWKHYEGPVEDAADRMNNTYLKANNQKDGVKSYGRMVDLLIAEHRKSK